MEQLVAIVHGRVQGVWFRDYTRQCARELGVAGQVKNQEDGTVHVIAEGAPHILETFLERIKEGPPLAKVSKIQVAWHTAKGEHDIFVIADS